MKRILHSVTCCFLFTVAFGQETIVIKDEDVGAGTTNWTKDHVYHLDGYVFVPEGGTLNIEAGTIVKGLNSPSTGDNASALIVARGAQIFACGTADEPIIFTAEFDDLNTPNDLTKNDKGLWGGLILLGSGIVGVDGGVQNVEGIPSTEGRAEYGGNNNSDNSGKLCYISIRHGGAKLEANNEINGLTLAGVGSETEIDHVEVYANLDDGIEWFGGAVNVRNAVVAFCGDDSFDWDQSWDGKGQFWFSLQDEIGNRAGEWDGSERADLGPKVIPVISHCTLIGAGPVSANEDNNDALRIRDDAAVQLHNSILTGFARDAIRIDNDNPGADSWDRFLNGDILFNNNVFFDFGGGMSFDEIADTDGGDQAALTSHLVENGNVIADPGLAGITRDPTGGLDPRINGNGAAFLKGVPVNDPYFEDVDYVGAFDSENNWAEGWTALWDNGYFGDLVSAVDDPVLSPVDAMMHVFPNPASSVVRIAFDLEQPAQLQVALYDMSGRLLSMTPERTYPAGSHHVESQIGSLEPGIYLATLSNEIGILARRVLVKQ
ncbi:MAG: T9SS type A sorting domain-containing protein [Saprospiraceae bacterium]|nr:T9SS type A sorting domain-containing protein [Saprospiraceae bacterium]